MELLSQTGHLRQRPNLSSCKAKLIPLVNWTPKKLRKCSTAVSKSLLGDNLSTFNKRRRRKRRKKESPWAWNFPPSDAMFVYFLSGDDVTWGWRHRIHVVTLELKCYGSFCCYSRSIPIIYFLIFEMNWIERISAICLFGFKEDMCG